MKKIFDFIIWVNGKNEVANFMALVCNSDNLQDQATFYWAFYNQINGKPGNKLTDGNLIMTGADYEAWSTNEYAWNWAAVQLGVTFDTAADQPAEAPEIAAPKAKKGKSI